MVRDAAAARGQVKSALCLRRFLALGFLLVALSPPLAVWPQELRGTVSGTVIDGSTNAPMGGVLVMMTGAGVTKTDDLGRFVLKDVLPGTWTIQALRTDTASPDDEPRPRTITVLPGEEIRDVRLRLVELATFKGRISDRDGNPLEQVRVFPLTVTYRQGRRTLATPGDRIGNFRTTNVTGEYEFRVPPGKYFIGADYTPPNQPITILTSGDLDPGNGTTRTYYPGILDSAAAVAIKVGGSDVVVADFRVFRENPELWKLSGTLVGAATESTSDSFRTFSFTPREAITFDPRVLRLLNVASRKSDATRFEIAGVPRGSYDLAVSAPMADGSSGRGILQVEVVDRNIDDLKVVLRPYRDVPGRVTVRGARNAFPIEQIEIRGSGSSFTKAGADGTFTLPNVSIGSQSIRVDGLPPDAYVADIRQGGVSLFDTAQTLAGPQFVVGDFTAPLEITVSPNAGTLRGIVETSRPQNVSGAIVALIPQPPHRFVQTYYRSSVVGSTGEFTFKGLAPGVYQLYAWESVLDTAWLNPDFISTYEGQGRTITIGAGDNVNTRVRLIPREN